MESVNNPTALLFYDQCLGGSNGHMATIPNSPIMESICAAHGIKTQKDFARFLREAADHLDGGGHA